MHIHIQFVLIDNISTLIYPIEKYIFHFQRVTHGQEEKDNTSSDKDVEPEASVSSIPVTVVRLVTLSFSKMYYIHLCKCINEIIY